MKSTTVWKITNGSKIEQAIKQRYPFASPGAVKVLEADLKRLIGPVIQQLNYEAKEWEREAENVREYAGYAWSEVEELKKDIERIEAEAIRQEMLKQFYSY